MSYYTFALLTVCFSTNQTAIILFHCVSRSVTVYMYKKDMLQDYLAFTSLLLLMELNHRLWYGRMIMQLIPTVIVPLMQMTIRTIVNVVLMDPHDTIETLQMTIRTIVNVVLMDPHDTIETLQMTIRTIINVVLMDPHDTIKTLL